MEMLGQDTCLLRTYLQVGNEILSDLNSNLTGSILVDKGRELSQKNEIGNFQLNYDYSIPDFDPGDQRVSIRESV
jgi:hypothetical protein